MAKRNYVIYADESDRKGAYCGNFFGGVILRAEDQEAITDRLNDKKLELNLGNELKWQKVSANYLSKYQEFIEYYFDFVASGRLKIRIMFTQNIHVPRGLTAEQRDDEYFILYYQFMKHAFGLRYCNPNGLDTINLTLLMDQIPDTTEKTRIFKEHLSKIPERARLKEANIALPLDQISDVDSKNHVILQGLDIILGAMCFRLNNKHLEKPDGQRTRGKRTIAKEKLFKAISARIRQGYPNFNIGTSTGTKSGPADRWHQPYRHWVFKPREHDVDPTRGKRWPHDDLHE